MKAGNTLEMQRIGARIRDARNAKDMTQADLAAQAELSLPTVSSIECGKSAMSLDSFVRIIEALQVSADSILRVNVPATTDIYQKDIAELLADCSAEETSAIMTSLIAMKQAIHSRKEAD